MWVGFKIHRVLGGLGQQDVIGKQKDLHQATEHTKVL